MLPTTLKLTLKILEVHTPVVDDVGGDAHFLGEKESLIDSEASNTETDFADAGTDGEPVILTATNGDYNFEEESAEHTAADSTKDTIPKVGTGELDKGAQAETAGQEPFRRSTRQRREPDRLTHAL